MNIFFPLNPHLFTFWLLSTLYLIKQGQRNKMQQMYLLVCSVRCQNEVGEREEPAAVTMCTRLGSMNQNGP